MILFNTPEKFADKGNECKVWMKNGYVYKAYYHTLNNIEKKVAKLNTLPEYEQEIVCGIMMGTNILVTRLKELKNWKYIVAQDPDRNWDKYMVEYLISKGYEKHGGYFRKNNIRIADIHVFNFGIDDNGEYKIIDANVEMH